MIVTSSFPSSDGDSRNAGVFVVDLARLLSQAGCEVTVVSPQRSTVTGDFDVLSFPRLGTEPSLSHLNPRSPSGAVKLLSVLLGGMVQVPVQARRRRVDHILALWAVPSGLLGLVARLTVGVRYSVWALGSDIWRIRDYPGGRTLLRTVLRRADHVYADGVALAQDTASISGQGCDFLATSRVLLPSPGRLWKDDKIHLVAIARFHEHKGVDVLVEAVSQLPQRHKENVQVHVYGDGPMRGQLEETVRARSLGDTVHFEGFADGQQAADALRSADLAIVPSRVESIPLILSDICNADAPMVVTDAGDMGDLVSRFHAGVVVSAGDARSLSNGISTALDARSDTSEGSDPSEGSDTSDRAGDGRANLAEYLSLRRSVERFLDDLSLGGAPTQ